MPISDRQPQDGDSVSSRQQLLASTDLEQRFEHNDIEEKLAALVEAAKGKDGLKLLYRGLEDENLIVRAEAYIQLKSLGELENPPLTLERGIPLRKGDRIYGVYRSRISYGDDWYYITAQIGKGYYTDPDPDYGFYQNHQDTKGNKYEYVYDGYWYEYDEDRYQNPPLVAYFLDRAKARSKTEEVYLKAFEKIVNFSICEITPAKSSEELDLRSWVEQKGVTPERFSEKWQGEWWTEDGEVREVREDDVYDLLVLIGLHQQKRYNLLREIWEPLGYAPLAFFEEHIIDRHCYLPLKAINCDL